MKKIVFMLALFGYINHAGAQKDKLLVPKAVCDKFTAMFPKASHVKWSKENDKELEAEFNNAGTQQAANFDLSGNWVVTETEVKTSALPAAVAQSLNKEFPGYKIEECEKVEKPGTTAYYECKIEKKEESWIVEVAPDGKILKKEVEKEEADEKD